MFNATEHETEIPLAPVKADRRDGIHTFCIEICALCCFYINVRVRGDPLYGIFCPCARLEGLAQSARVLGTPPPPSPSLLWWVEAGDRVGEAVQIVIVQP